MTCVLDAEQAFAHQQHPAVELLKLKQIGFADMMALDKVNLADPAQVRKVRNWLDDQFNQLRIVEADASEQVGLLCGSNSCHAAVFV